jgi:beta-lactamase regulating signal transducer with metallopeptidase domain
MVAVNVMQFLASQPWVERLGWTLIHFLWQGVLISAIYAAARIWVANSSSPKTRYILACVALAAMMAAPLVTWSLMRSSNAAPVSASLISRVPVTASTVTATPPVSFIGTVSGVQPAQFLPWVVAIWLAGAIALWIRLIGGWIVAARIGSTLVRPAPPEWQQTLNRLKARVGVTRPVRLLISALVQAPAVIGWLRPVALVPIGALAGLPSEQIEALLIHELAHIRRHDYLVNILQSVAESLLFYHPAVWWVSGHIRAERELCCDDVAVSLSGDAFTYALALAESRIVARGPPSSCYDRKRRVAGGPNRKVAGSAGTAIADAPVAGSHGERDSSGISGCRRVRPVRRFAAI